MPKELTLIAANAAYYDAFNAGDREAMAAVWAQENVSCIHPGWPPLFGRRAVIASYGEIFRNPRQEPIQRSHENAVLGESEGRVICLESVGEATLVATNWFKLDQGQWLLVHHQASQLAVDASALESRKAMH